MIISRVYQIDNKTCGQCHEQCFDSCTGPSDEECLQCAANLKEDNRCVAKCSPSRIERNGQCIACYDVVLLDKTLNKTENKCLENNSCPGENQQRDLLYKQLLITTLNNISVGYFEMNATASMNYDFGERLICRECHQSCNKYLTALKAIPGIESTLDNFTNMISELKSAEDERERLLVLLKFFNPDFSSRVVSNRGYYYVLYSSLQSSKTLK